jgi:AcrR family transcriptional regulator
VAEFFAVTEGLLAEKSFQEVTVAEIISRTPHSRSSFYHHFSGKVDVLVALAATVLDDAYRAPGIWDARPGRERAIAMRASFAPTLRMWSDHGDVIGAVVEQMHTTPALSRVWTATFRRFVDALAEQVATEGVKGSAPPGVTPELMATVLVCGIERTLYVSTRGLEPRLPSAHSAVPAIEWLTVTAIYGGAQPSHGQSRLPGNEFPASPGRPPHLITRTQTDSSAVAILDALRSLLLEFGLDRLSVAQISTHAGVSRSTFYFYFDNKNAAFAALYRDLSDSTLAGLQRLWAIDRTDRELLTEVLSDWLRIDQPAIAILRSALHEWPRRPELRLVYQQGMSAMADTLEAIITEDRLAGFAADGPPAPALTATLLWTVERSVAGALAGEEHLEEVDDVIAFLSKLLTSAIYGRPKPQEGSPCAQL